MNWDAIGAIGQILGSLAVFITLGYLTVQIRHAREQMSRSARAARYDAVRQYFAFGAENPELSKVHFKVRQSLGNAADDPWTQFVLEHGGTGEEALRLNFAEFMYWSVAEQNIGIIGDLTRGERSQFESALRLIYGGPLPLRAKWYEATKGRLNPDAVRYIDNVLAQPN